MASHLLLGTVLNYVSSVAAGNTGIASYYGGNLVGGNCLFSSYTIPAGIFGTALSGANWNAASLCGACLSVTGPRGNIKVMVVDSCPGCAVNQLDLFQNAFSNIGDPSAGTVPISWSVVTCGITSPIMVRNKSGTSRYWFSMQVVNANNQVTALDVSTDGGASWQRTTRQDYNYFQKSDGGGFGTDTVTVRVTCSSGKQVTLANIGVADSTSYTAPGNC